MQHRCHLSHQLKVLQVTSDVFVGQAVNAHAVLWRCCCCYCGLGSQDGFEGCLKYLLGKKVG